VLRARPGLPRRCSILGNLAATVLKDFIRLENVAKQLGLEINRSKCEVVGHMA
jgi:hypothetical protein